MKTWHERTEHWPNVAISQLNTSLTWKQRVPSLKTSVIKHSSVTMKASSSRSPVWNTSAHTHLAVNSSSTATVPSGPSGDWDSSQDQRRETKLLSNNPQIEKSPWKLLDFKKKKKTTLPERWTWAQNYKSLKSNFGIIFSFWPLFVTFCNLNIILHFYHIFCTRPLSKHCIEKINSAS